MTAMLPQDFSDLEPFASDWCLATETERWDKRISTPMPELLDMYDAVTPRLEAAIEFCDAHLLAELPPDVERLLQLVYSYAMVAMAVEVFGQPKPTDSADAVLIRVKEPMP